MGAPELLAAVSDSSIACVALADGMYTMPRELKLEHSLRLVAQPGAAPVINGESNGGTATLSVGPDATVELVGLTITGGNNTSTNFSESPRSAGGVLNLGTLTMVDCDVNNNIGSFYGAGVTNSGNLTLHSCKVHSNRFPRGCGLLPVPQGGDCIINRPVWQSSGEGGGIRSSRGLYPGVGNRTYLPMPTTTLIDTHVFNNTAGNGGGIVCVDSGVTLINSSVYNNTASGDPLDDGGQGGGILHSCQMACRRPNSTLVDSLVYNNSASLGGGISIFAGTMNLSHSFVHNNMAVVADAGIRITIKSPVKDHSRQDVLFLTAGSGVFDN